MHEAPNRFHSGSSSFVHRDFKWRVTTPREQTYVDLEPGKPCPYYISYMSKWLIAEALEKLFVVFRLYCFFPKGFGRLGSDGSEGSEGKDGKGGSSAADGMAGS